MNNSNISNYTGVQESLKNINALTTASEAHGLLCALFCFGDDISFSAWFRSLMPKELEDADIDAKDSILVLKAMFEDVKIIFKNRDISLLEIFLPMDETIQSRLKDLSIWITGFLSGVGLFGIDEKNYNSEIIKEALHDITQISFVDYDAVEEDENSEYDFSKVLEFVRVAVLLIGSENSKI